MGITFWNDSKIGGISPEANPKSELWGSFSKKSDGLTGSSRLTSSGHLPDFLMRRALLAPGLILTVPPDPDRSACLCRVCLC
ncbi:MAG: hypothetical protein ACK4GC_11205 [Paracoccaceae bacterium]